ILDTLVLPPQLPSLPPDFTSTISHRKRTTIVPQQHRISTPSYLTPSYLATAIETIEPPPPRPRIAKFEPSDAVELLVLPEKNMGFYKIPVIFLDFLLARDFTVVVVAVAWAAPPLQPPSLLLSPLDMCRRHHRTCFYVI
nr:hypothetical protein [Tanacetum cinerariifolium]